MSLEIVIGRFLIITGTAFLLARNLNWQFIISKIKGCM